MEVKKRHFQRSVPELRRKLRLRRCPFCQSKRAWGKKAQKPLTLSCCASKLVRGFTVFYENAFFN